MTWPGSIPRVLWTRCECPRCSSIEFSTAEPGPIWTRLQEADGDEKKLKKLGENTPYKRPGQPVELAPVYVLPASHEGNITGEIYGVTGGLGIV